MIKHPTRAALLALSAALAVAGCGSQQPAAPAAQETAAAPASEASAVPAAPAASEAPAAAAAPAAPVASTAPAAAPAKKEVAIRGKNSLESKCLAKVGKETGARVIGTNRIEESEAAIGIFVNIEGAEAPWRCLAYRDGTVGEIMYTGSEGAM